MHRVTALVTAVSLALGAAVPAHAEDEALRKELDALRQQVAALQAEVNEMRTAKATPVVAAQTAETPVIAPAPAPAMAVAQTSPPPAQRGIGSDSTRLWGYGELNYNHPTGDAGKSQADLRRAVLGFSHAFDEDTHVYGELEWEHAVVSADDQGESEDGKHAGLEEMKDGQPESGELDSRARWAGMLCVRDGE